MSKRAASTGISCPGCSWNFDTETHIPFVGSCGDSICAACINEGKIKTCPECNLSGSFNSHQKNNLAMKFLTARTENGTNESKKVKLDMDMETFAPVEPVPAILDPKNRHFFAQIVNQLNPRTFVNLATTCKTLHNYCFNSNDVKISYNVWSMDFRYCFGPSLMYQLVEEKKNDRWSEKHHYMDYAGYKYGFLISAACRRTLKNYPFSLKLGKLRLQTKADAEFFGSLRTFLAEFQIEHINKVNGRCIEDWHGFMQLLKDFHVKEVKLDYCNLPEDVRGEVLEYLLYNMTYVNIISISIPEDMIVNVTMPALNLGRIDISKETFAKLVKKWADSTDDIDWSFNECPFEFGIDSLFEETLPFYHKGSVPTKRPLAFYKKNKFRKFYILRSDGKVVCCNNNTEFYVYMVDPLKYPPCLLPHSNESPSETDTDESEDEPMSDDEPESGDDSDAEPGEQSNN